MSEPESIVPPEGSPMGIASTSLVSRLCNVLAAPTEVIDEIKAGPPKTANWLVPVLLVIVVGWIGSWLVMNQESVKQQLSDMQEKQLQKMIEKGSMTREQLEAQRPMIEKVSNISRQVGAFLMVPVTVFFSLFGWALVLWLLGRSVLSGAAPAPPLTYGKAMEAVGLASMVLLIESIVKTLLIVTFGSLFAGPSLAMIVIKDFDPTNLTHSLLAAVDAMTFWSLAVKAVALSRLRGVSFGKAGLWLLGVWIVLTGLLIGGSQFVQRVFGGG